MMTFVYLSIDIVSLPQILVTNLMDDCIDNGTSDDTGNVDLDLKIPIAHLCVTLTLLDIFSGNNKTWLITNCQKICFVLLQFIF